MQFVLVRRHLCAKFLFLRPLQAFEFHRNCPLCLPSQLPYSNPLFTAASFSPPSIPPSPRVLQTTADLPFLHPASLISIHDNGGLSFPMKCSCILRCCSRSQVILGHYNKKKKKKNYQGFPTASDSKECCECAHVNESERGAEVLPKIQLQLHFAVDLVFVHRYFV